MKALSFLHYFLYKDPEIFCRENSKKLLHKWQKKYRKPLWRLNNKKFKKHHAKTEVLIVPCLFLSFWTVMWLGSDAQKSTFYVFLIFSSVVLFFTIMLLAWRKSLMIRVLYFLRIDVQPHGYQASLMQSMILEFLPHLLKFVPFKF